MNTYIFSIFTYFSYTFSVAISYKLAYTFNYKVFEVGI